MTSMDAEASKALSIIQKCIDDGRYRLLRHFTKQMDRRGLYWLDLLAVIDKPDSVEDDGLDRYDRPKWIVGGETADGLPVGIVCVLDRDERGDETVFITLYWED